MVPNRRVLAGLNSLMYKVTKPSLQSLTALLVAFSLTLQPNASRSQQSESTVDAASQVTEEDVASDTTQPTQVEVNPVADDEDIAARLERILNATEWYKNAEVIVEEGVVFLKGTTTSDAHKQWATNLASNTQDVVTVANRMQVQDPSVSDFSSAWQELEKLRRNLIEAVPVTIVATVLFVAAWLFAKLLAQLARRVSQRRTESHLLSEIIAKAVAIPALLIGIYLALRVTGLTRMAATVLGGTGLLGLVLGIAFRDIAENYLASILLSIQRPFRAGDFILIEGRQGIVQSVTTRGTTLMTLEGNHIQIPNSTIYKGIIENFTANPNMRVDFIVGIDYECSVAEAQETIYGVLLRHPAVLEEPEPLVLLDELAAATVNLQVLFWINASEHSVLKVRSSVVRQTKLALEEAGFTMPDEAREVIFPKGVPVNMLDHALATQEPRKPQASVTQDGELVTASEGDLGSESTQIERQAEASRRPEESSELLTESNSSTM